MVRALSDSGYILRPPTAGIEPKCASTMRVTNVIEAATGGILFYNYGADYDAGNINFYDVLFYNDGKNVKVVGFVLISNQKIPEMYGGIEGFLILTKLLTLILVQ